MESLKRLGHNVEVWEKDFINYSEDPDFECVLQETVTRSSADCIFSFDYFPLISKVSQDRGLPYVSWIYDCPHYTLQSDTLSNSCNHVYVFDYALAERYRREGFETVGYMPLPVNTHRLRNLIGDKKRNYSHDISFVGSLYNDDHNYYDQISYLPEYVRGYLDSVIKVQELIYGMDIPSQILSGEIYEEIAKYVNADLGNGFRSIKRDFICDMLRRKVTVNERRNLLSLLGNRFNIDLFSGSKPTNDLKINYKGIADYYSEMPYIFASSKININISLRSILTGIPLRVVDILGAGGFCLTNYQAEMAEYFENGRELVWYESPEDMLEKAEYFLHHDEEREKIAMNGADAAERMFSYDVLLPKIMNNI